MIQTSRATEIARLLVAACDRDFAKARRVALATKDETAMDLIYADPDKVDEATRRHRYWVAVALRVARLAKIADAQAARAAARAQA